MPMLDSMPEGSFTNNEAWRILTRPVGRIQGDIDINSADIDIVVGKPPVLEVAAALRIDQGLLDGGLEFLIGKDKKHTVEAATLLVIKEMRRFLPPSQIYIECIVAGHDRQTHATIERVIIQRARSIVIRHGVALLRPL